MLIDPNTPASAATQAGADDVVKDVTADTFMAEVIDASMQVPVIVDFWAPWCGPCKQLGPALEKVVRASGGRVRLAKIDIDQEPMIAQQLRIQSIPTVYAFKDGRPVDGFQGALPESQIKAFVERLVGEGATQSPIEQALEQALQALESGDAGTASAIFAQILEHEPENARARAGLARLYVEAGEIEAAEEMLQTITEQDRRDSFVASAVSALELAKSGAESGDVEDLRRRVEANPDDHQTRFDLAMAYFARNRGEEAAEEMLEIVRRDREWNEEAARQQLVKFFEAWGPTDPLTLKVRRRLSSLLFS